MGLIPQPCYYYGEIYGGFSWRIPSTYYAECASWIHTNSIDIGRDYVNTSRCGRCTYNAIYPPTTAATGSAPNVMGMRPTSPMYAHPVLTTAAAVSNGTGDAQQHPKREEHVKAVNELSRLALGPPLRSDYDNS